MMFMYWVILTVSVVILAVLSQIEVTEDPVVVDRRVVLIGTPTEVYRYAADFKLYAKWFPSVYSYESLDERAIGVGKKYTQVSYVPWLGERKHTIMLVDYAPPYLLAYIEDDWTQSKVEIIVERVNSKHTKLTWKLRSRWRNQLFKYVIAPVIGFVYDGTAKHAMLNLRMLFQN